MNPHLQHNNGATGGGGKSANCITLQKNVTFRLMDENNGHNTAHSSYPTLPNAKSTFRLCGCFWAFKYYFEQSIAGSSTGTTTTIESDACQMYLYLTRTHDYSDIEFQLYCDSGSKANVGGWTLSLMKWASVKVSFINPETKQIISHKKAEGETRCGKLLCQCRQTKLCLRKVNFCSADYLQPFYVINKCEKPQLSVPATYYTSVDAIVSVTLFPQNPKSVNTTSVYDLYWKSQQEASKRIFHAKIGTDFKLEAKDREFPCHKCILAGHSDVFSKMFSTDTKQQKASSSSPTKLVMENISAVGVESFLKYLYYGDTSFAELPVNVAFELIRAAEKFKIPHLKKTSLEILLSKPLDDFDCGTALDMYLFAMNIGNNNTISCCCLDDTLSVIPGRRYFLQIMMSLKRAGHRVIHSTFSRWIKTDYISPENRSSQTYPTENLDDKVDSLNSGLLMEL